MYHATASWDKFDRWSYGIQLVRAADSVAANIAEAEGRWHGPDRRRLLYIARGSLYELEHWLGTATDRGRPIDTEDIDELGRLLNGLIRRSGEL